MAKKFTDSDATRIIAALEARQGRKTKDGAQVSSTWGTVGAVDAANKFASAYLYGETDGAYMSEGFRIPETMYLSVGDVVKVSINYATGERWVSEAHFPASDFKKLAINHQTGEVLQGDGTVAPTVKTLGGATTHGALTGVTSDQHHAQVHAIGGADHTGTLAHSATTGQTATDHHPAPAAGPDANVTIDSAGAAGTASTFARSGHGHQIVTTAGPGAAIGPLVGAAGATGAVARAGHGHAFAGGTSFPGSPATDDLYYRYDRNMWFEFDGTIWKCCCPHQIQLGVQNAIMPISATQGGYLACALPALIGNADLYILRHKAAVYVGGGTALSGSHHWVGVLNAFRTNTATTDLVDTLTLNSGTSSTWRDFDTAINARLNNGTAHNALEVSWTKTGTPGTLRAHHTISFLYVG